MKKSVLVLTIAMLTFCSFTEDNSTDEVVISGKIENPNSDTLSILNSQYDVIRTIVLNADNSFRDTLQVSEGYYHLNDGKEGTTIYLKPQFNLSLTLNTIEFDESIVYEGNGANENNYLAQKALLAESFGRLNYYGYYAKLSEKEFLNLTDSLYNLQVNLLENTSSLDQGFIFVESKSLEYSKLEKYSNFEKMNRYVTGNKGFEVSDSFPDPFIDVDVSNEKLLIAPNYIRFIGFYLNTKYKETYHEKDENRDYTITFLQTINQEISNPLIKEELVYNHGKSSLIRTKHLDSLYNEIGTLITNEKYLAEITSSYNKLKKTEKGVFSPLFELTDIDGKSISLTDLQGQLVYVDIWATWCMPCIKEIPSLKSLEEHFKGKAIQFVSICKDDTRERWEKMVKEKELGGIQLFAPDQNIPFFKDYSVNGIPRFILIDAEGKIIDSNAKRPTHPKLIEEIESYL